MTKMTIRLPKGLLQRIKVDAKRNGRKASGHARFVLDAQIPQTGKPARR